METHVIQATAEVEIEDRILTATVDCIARSGVAKTTLDDIARAAGCSRATIYRTFAGGKDAIVCAAGQRELRNFFIALEVDVASAASLEDALVVALSQASRALIGHPSLQYLVTYEPEVVLPLLAFDGIDPLLAWSGGFARTHLARFLDPGAAYEVGEWAARVVLGYGLASDSPFALADPAVARHLVRTFLLPGLPVPAAVSGPVPPTPHTVQE
jgi:AcrR family transcriptional regulator